MNNPLAAPLRAASLSLKVGKLIISKARIHHLKKLSKKHDPQFNGLDSHIADYTNKALSKINSASQLFTSDSLPQTIKELPVKKKSYKFLKKTLIFGALSALCYVISQKLLNAKPSEIPPRNDQVSGEENPGGGNYVFNTSTQPE